MKEKILLTGCNGQLGSELRKQQASLPNAEWICTDVDELDITDHSAVFRFVEEMGITGIVNCAAYTAVDKAEMNLGLCERLNAVAPAYLASAINKRGGWMIQISTDYVFDGNASVPYTEDMTTCPNSVYGRTKRQGEVAVLDHCPNSVIIRTAWLYSTFGSNFVKTMMRLGNERESLNVVFDQIGSPTYARDLATAIITVIREGIKPGIYHFTNEGVASWYDFTHAIFEMANIKNCALHPIRSKDYPTPAKRPAFSVLDKAKIKQTYDLQIPHWRDSLAECIDKLLEQ